MSFRWLLHPEPMQDCVLMDKKHYKVKRWLSRAQQDCVLMDKKHYKDMII